MLAHSATYFYQFVETATRSSSSSTPTCTFRRAARPLTVTRAFRGSYQWAPDGRRVDAAGAKYSARHAAGVQSSPTGNTVPEILAYLKRAAAADGTRPNGTFYYMQNADVRSTARHDGFAAAVAELNTLGFAAEVEHGVVPAGRKDILRPHHRLAEGPAAAHANCRLLPARWSTT